MATLDDRLADFIADRLPEEGSVVELLCMDHNGTYLIPFACRRIANTWRNSKTDEVIEVEVAGWRPR